MSKDQDTSKKLEAYLQAKFPDRKDLVLKAMERTDVGYSYETCFLTLEWQVATGPLSQRLVVRLEPEIGPVPPYDIRPQYEVMKGLEGCGIPVPKILWLEENRQVLGNRFFIMEAVDGKDLYMTYMNHPEHRRTLEMEYISILANLHNIDYDALNLTVFGNRESMVEKIGKEIDRWERIIVNSQYAPLPVVAEAVSWLHNNIPQDSAMALCHGDFHSNNLLAHEDHIVAVLDWEMVKIGDPVSDLGWAILFTQILTGFWNEADLVKTYENVSGRKVNEKTLFFWKILSQIKLTAICLAALRASMEHENTDVRQATIGLMGVPGILDGTAKMLGF